MKQKINRKPTNFFSIKIIAILTMMSIIIVISLLFGWMSIEEKNERQTNSIESTHKGLQSVINEHIKQLNIYFEHRIDFINADDRIVNAIINGDRKELLAINKNRYEILQEEILGLNNMHYHSADGTTLLRLHKPSSYGDKIALKRPLIAKVHKEKVSSYSFDVGNSGASYRFIYPLFSKEKKYIGALEFGIDPKIFLDKIKEIFEMDSALIVKERELVKSDSYIKENSSYINDYSLVLTSSDLFQTLTATFISKLSDSKININEKSYYLHNTINLLDLNKETIGKIIVIQDFSFESNQQENFFKNLIFGTLFLLIVVYFIISMTVGKLIAKIEYSYKEFQAVSESMNQGLFVLDKNNNTRYINPSAQDLLGYSKENLCGVNIHNMIHQHTSQEFCPIENMKSSQTTLHIDDDIFIHKSGQEVSVRYSASPLIIDNKPEGVVCVFSDTTKEKEFQKIKDRERLLYIKGPVVVMHWINKENLPLKYISNSISKWGYTADELLLTETSFLFMAYDDDREGLTEKITQYSQSNEDTFEHYFRIKTGDSRIIWVYAYITFDRDEKGVIESYYSYLLDITELKNAEIIAKKDASTDALTKILNRQKFDEEYAKEFTRSLRYKSTLSLIMFDIDHFKDVNDNYGHLVGDFVLKELANLVKNELRASDVFARWGGEEFMILLPEISLDSAVDTAQKIRKSIAEHYFEEVQYISCSFGVIDVSEFQEIKSSLSYVDKLLYQAKENGRNRVEYEVSTKEYKEPLKSNQ